MKKPPVELTPDQKENLARLAKFVLVPALGYLATRQIYIHRDQMTVYVQYYKDKKDNGFKIGLSRWNQKGFAEFGGVHTDNDEFQVDISNMTETDIEEVRETFTVEHNKKTFEE